MQALPKSRAFVHARAVKLSGTRLSQDITTHARAQHLLAIRGSGALRPKAAQSEKLFRQTAPSFRDRREFDQPRST